MYSANGKEEGSACLARVWVGVVSSICSLMVVIIPNIDVTATSFKKAMFQYDNQLYRNREFIYNFNNL